ncbi:MAG: transcription termination/antitermination NusG family protein [Nitrospirota bacterium]
MWYAIYTKPAKEDLVSLRLQSIGIEVLNPKLRTKKYKQNRLVEVVETLFPCYIFACFEKERFAHLITYTTGVRYIVGKSCPIIVQDEIVCTIKERIGEDDIINLSPIRFERGARVRILEGPFRNFYGIFEREVKGPERVMILLEALHFRIELDGCLLDVA